MNEISDLTILQSYGTIIRLKWSWPANCQETYVIWERGTPFSGSTAKAREYVTISRRDYIAAGDHFDIPAGDDDDDFDIMISSVHQQPSKQQGLGIRRCVWQRSLITISYGFHFSNLGGTEIRFRYHPVSWHPQLAFGYKQYCSPRDESDCDGIEIIPQSTEPTDPAYFAKRHNSYQLNRNQPFPPDRYGRLFVADPVYAHCIKFHHPDRKNREKAKVGY